MDPIDMSREQETDAYIRLKLRELGIQRRPNTITVSDGFTRQVMEAVAASEHKERLTRDLVVLASSLAPLSVWSLWLGVRRDLFSVTDWPLIGRFCADTYQLVLQYGTLTFAMIGGCLLTVHLVRRRAELLEYVTSYLQAARIFANTSG